LHALIKQGYSVEALAEQGRGILSYLKAGQ